MASLLSRAKPFGQSALALARGEITPLAALTILAAGALAFMDIADDFSEAESRAFDQHVLSSLHPGPDLSVPIGPTWLAHTAQDLTALGSVSVLLVVALIAIGNLVMQGRRLQAMLLGFALAGGLVLSETMKSVFERSRPPDLYHSAEFLNASFPSGHALLSTVSYLTLGAMLARGLKRRREKLFALGVALTLALLVGATRVYLGVHWASDVLAGWCLGAAWAMACWLIEWGIEKRAGSPTATPDTPAESG